MRQPSMIKCLPGALGVCLAPLLFGSINQDGKAVVGLLLATSTLLLANELGDHRHRIFNRTLGWLLLGIALASTLSLPAGWLKWISPERYELARLFPLSETATPSWIPIAISPARAYNRLWELSLCLAAFGTLRQAASFRQFPVVFAWMISVTVALVGFSDIIYRLNDYQSMLGLWTPQFTRGAGTFQNRNLFAGWIYAGSLLGIGLVVRYLAPLRSARGSLVPPPKPHRGLATVVGILLLTGIGMAILSSSRGAILTFGFGLLLALSLLDRRTKDQTRNLGTSVALALGLCFLLGIGDTLFSRLTRLKEDIRNQEQYGKVKIWEDSIQIAQRFPILGSGLGSYVNAARLYKTSQPDMIAVHAENDYLEVLVENGPLALIAFLLFLGIGFVRILRESLTERHSEPELLIFSFSAFSVLALQATIEFVWQVSSTAVLAAATLGLAAGIIDCRSRPISPAPLTPTKILRNLLGGGLLLLVSAANGMAFADYIRSTHSWSENDKTTARRLIERSSRFWPWGVERQLAWTRANIGRLTEAPPPLRQGIGKEMVHKLEGFLRKDPMDWELRVELAWVHLRCFGASSSALETALRACRANPLQFRIPLSFAAFLEFVAPSECFRFLKEVPFGPGTEPALVMAFRLKLDPSQIWELVPPTREGFLQLGDTALAHNMPKLAALAFERVGPSLPREVVAQKFLQAQHHDIVLELLKNGPYHRAERVIRAEAYLALGDWGASLLESELAWGNSMSGDVPHPEHESAITNTPVGNSTARSIRPTAEELVAQDFARTRTAANATSEQLSRLRAHSLRYPHNTIIVMALLRIETDLGNLREAAFLSAQLAKNRLRTEAESSRR